jgi:hypothetical protein
MQLMCAYAFLGRRQEMRGLKPFMEADLAALENRPDRNRELALAWSAATQTRASALDVRDALEAATTRAERPLRPDNRL